MMKQENEKLHLLINSLSERIEDLERKNNHLECRCQQLEEKERGFANVDPDTWMQEAMDRH